MDTVHVVRQQERNVDLGIKDFYLYEHEDGEIEVSSSMTLERAESLIKSRVMTRDSMVTSSWLPSKPPPPLTCSLNRIFALPDKLKSTATAFMKWILSVQRLKRGQPGFLGWHFQADRAKFIHTDKILSQFTKSTISMDQIIPWTSLAGLRNGLASGDCSKLNSHCGISSWLGFLKVFVEVSQAERGMLGMLYSIHCPKLI